jgi:RNA-directed DNA polymerase
LPPKLSRPIEKVRSLQRKLYLKAKREKEFRFYSLYDKLYRPDVLQVAWQHCRRNGGAPGVDGLDVERVRQEIGEEEFLRQIAKELQERRYRPAPVKRVYLPKPGGEKRPLGIPTVKDRVVQTACLLVLLPIFEADFHDCSYAYRPKRSAHDAVRAVVTHLKAGFTAVYDVDLSKCFDELPHETIMEAVAARVADGRILRLIKAWLTAPVVEPGGPRQGKRSRKGTPQGGVISPLLANVVLNHLDQGWNAPGGPRERYNARLVRYADDIVVLARYIGRPLIEAMTRLTAEVGLRVNPEKTHILDLRAGDRLEFLGYEIYFGRDRHRPLVLKPGRKAIVRLKHRVREIVARKQLHRRWDGMIAELNPVLRGWREYFSLSNVSRVFWKLDFFITARFYRVGRKASQRRAKTFTPGVFVTLQKMGLYSLVLARPAKA